jgi:hypothetical protein
MMPKQDQLEAEIEEFIRERSLGEIWDRARVPARTKAQMEADIAELRRRMRNPDIMDAFISCVRKGTIINSGERREGTIVWIVPDALTPAG